MTQTDPIPAGPLQPQSRMWLGPRVVLLAGFGVLMALMAFIWIDADRTLQEIETRSSQIRQDFLSRERSLAQIQLGLYESGNIVRDYILAGSNQSVSSVLGTQFHSLRDDTTAELRACLQSLPPGREAPFQRLAAELDRYWGTVDPVFQWDANQKQNRGDSYLRSDVGSQRAAVLAVAKDLSAVNGGDRQEAENGIAEVFAQLRRRLQAVTGIVFGLGFLLAAATILYTMRLEKNAEEKYRETLRSRHQLKELSKRLVDAQEQERRTISRELHDQVGQSLGALLMDVETLADLPGGDHAFRHELQSIKVLAEGCVNEVRHMALLLRPSMLDDLGLAAALEWQAREASKRTGMMVDLVDEGVSEALPEEHKICVYRVVQEALNNCSKHASAKNVRVTIRQEPERLVLTVRDDGEGFDPSRARGLGLVGMRERVGQLGGELEVDSSIGRGTTLRVAMPLPPNWAAAT